MRTVIAGIAKTGTTGLFYKIRNSLVGEVRELFEPPSYAEEPGDANRHVLAKVLVSPTTINNLPSFGDFDKKVKIIRDPRDQFVSALLYGIGYHAPYGEERGKVSLILNLLRKKEEQSSLVSCMELVRQHNRLAGRDYSEKALQDGPRNQAEHLSAFWDGLQGYHLVRYEDFVDNSLTALEEYLGFALCGAAEVDSVFQRVVRTKAYANWKHWFCVEDLEMFRLVYCGLMERYGYGADWELAGEQVVSPEHASGYLQRLVQERAVITAKQRAAGPGAEARQP